MMHNFKPGDTVICIDDTKQIPQTGSVKKGNVYTVKSVTNSDLYLVGLKWSRAVWRFEHAKQKKTVSIQTIHEVELCEDCYSVLENLGILVD